MRVIQRVYIDIFAMKKKEGERIRGKYQGEEKQRRVWTDGRTGIEGSIRGPPQSWGLTCRWFRGFGLMIKET